MMFEGSGRICLPQAAICLLSGAQVTLLIIMALQLLAPPIKLADAFFIDSKQSPGTSEWNYSDQVAWARQHRDCSGRAQSPIDIQHKNVIISQHLRLHFYNYDQQLKFKLSNAHHTIKMNPLGPAYEQSLLEGGGAHGGRPMHSNDSSIHDIITADEYVEFATETSQQANHHQGQHPESNAAAKSPQIHNKERLMGLPDDSPPGSSGGRVPAGSRHASGIKRLQNSNNLNENNNNNNNIEHEQASGKAGEPYEGAPAIKLDWLDDGNNEFKLRDIHFHWAERRDNGSEHAIDGRRAAMEMHLVHIKHGLDKSKIGFTSDSVTVIAILIESHRKSNADFNPIVNELARINSTEQAQSIEYKSIYDLLPSNLDAFYTYSGSLTTPPCYQVVNWIVMAERLNMNAKQIEMFRNLYAPPHDHGGSDDDNNEQDKPQGGNRPRGPYDSRHQSFQTLTSESVLPSSGDHDDDDEHESSKENVETMIMPNVRHLQALNNRTILASFTKYGSRLKAALNQANSIHIGPIGCYCCSAQLLGGVATSVAVSLLVAIIQLTSNSGNLVSR